jgi:hypothetical protein
MRVNKFETLDFEAGTLKSKCTKQLIANLKKISQVQVVDSKGKIVMTFQKVVEA